MWRQHRMALFHCRVRRFRKAAHLSQRELALLVGLHTQGVMSEIEAGRRTPGVRLAIGVEIVFGVPAREQFPRLSDVIEHDVLESARSLHAELLRTGERPATQAFLAALIQRLDSFNP